jgi:hypothetical protein
MMRQQRVQLSFEATEQASAQLVASRFTAKTEELCPFSTVSTQSGSRALKIAARKPPANPCCNCLVASSRSFGLWGAMRRRAAQHHVHKQGMVPATMSREGFTEFVAREDAFYLHLARARVLQLAGRENVWKGN